MAIPLIAAVPAALGKAAAFAKGLTGLGSVAGVAKGGAGTMGAFGKGAAIKRMAGEKLASLMGKGASIKTGIKDLSKMAPDEMIDYMRNLKTKDVLNAGLNMSDDAGIIDRIKRSGTIEGFTKNLGMPMTRNDIAMAVAPDLLFGGLTAATTEGDIVDKAIAGAGSAVGGIAGGIGARGILGPKSNLGVLGTEMVGGMLGDQVGYGAAENLIRLKNGGQTPLEQKMAEGDEAYRQQIMEQLRQQYGLI